MQEDKPIDQKRYLKIIPKPKTGTRTVLLTKPGQGLPLFSGEGNVDMVCGKCSVVLVHAIIEGQIRNIVLQCPVCRFYNEIP